MAHKQSLSDKNAAYIARIRAQQTNNETTCDFQTEKKINLFGDNNDLLAKAKVEPSKKKSKFVQLPDMGLTETQLLTKYQITVDKIGAGAFAKIQIVKEHQTGTSYALKYVKTRGVSYIDINTFKKEILFLSKLTNHPNIIRMYDFCESTTALFMVLEYCNGGDVAQHLDKCKRFTEMEAKHITKQIVAGLCYCHQYNIVHRDLKPDNLMYNNGVIKLIDFGLAGDCTYDALKTACGTPHFAAPELINGHNYKTEADMWSLGVCLYLFICGILPFTERTNNQQKLLQIIKTGVFAFDDKVFDECHVSLKDLITSLLCLNVKQRLTAQHARNHAWFTVKCVKNRNESVNRQRHNNFGHKNMNNNNGNINGLQRNNNMNNNIKFGNEQKQTNNKQIGGNNMNNARNEATQIQNTCTQFNGAQTNNMKFNTQTAKHQTFGHNNMNSNNMQKRENNFGGPQSHPFNNQHNNNNNMQQRNNARNFPRQQSHGFSQMQAQKVNNQNMNNMQQFQRFNNANMNQHKMNNTRFNHQNANNQTSGHNKMNNNNMNNMQQRNNMHNFARQQSYPFDQNKNINQHTQFAHNNNINKHNQHDMNNIKRNMSTTPMTQLRHQPMKPIVKPFNQNNNIMPINNQSINNDTHY